MNTENTHPYNRGKNTGNFENVDCANNGRRLCRTQNPPIRLGEAYTH